MRNRNVDSNTIPGVESDFECLERRRNKRERSIPLRALQVRKFPITPLHNSSSPLPSPPTLIAYNFRASSRHATRLRSSSRARVYPTVYLRRARYRISARDVPRARGIPISRDNASSRLAPASRRAGEGLPSGSSLTD